MSHSPDSAVILAALEPLLTRFLTADDVADRLARDRAAVARDARKGFIPGAKKIAGEWRFHAAPFTAWARDWWDPQQEPSFDVWLASLTTGHCD